MKRSKYFLVFITICSFYACENEMNGQQAITEKTAHRIVSLSGFLTETLYDLGQGENIVGIDITSVYPAIANQLPKLGHISQLNAEAILELQPSIIFIEKMEQLPEAVLQLKNAGIKVVEIPTTHHFNNAINASKKIAEHIDVNTSKIEAMKADIERDSLKLVALLDDKKNKSKTLFIYARGAGRLMIGGNNTSAAAIIEKAGGENAIKTIDNFEALTPEALVEAQPEVILMFTSGLKSLDGKKGLAQITGMSETKAYKNNRIIAMDGDYLTSFSKRSVKAAIELAEKL